MVQRRKRQPDSLSIISGISVFLLSIPVIIILIYGFIVFRSAQGFSHTVLLSISLTLASSATAAAIVFAVFTPLAYELARRRNSLLETASDIPASIPHPIIGIALLILDSPITPTGRFLNYIGINFFDTFQGLVAALVIVSAPVYIRAAQSLFSSRRVEPELLASSLGASRLKVLYTVVVADSLRGVMSASLTAMSRAMSEFGSIAIVAYYVLQAPFSGVEPASVLIYEYYGYYGPQVAVTVSALMILISMAVIIAMRIVSRAKRKYSSGRVVR